MVAVASGPLSDSESRAPGPGPGHGPTVEAGPADRRMSLRVHSLPVSPLGMGGRRGAPAGESPANMSSVIMTFRWSLRVGP